MHNGVESKKAHAKTDTVVTNQRIPFLSTINLPRSRVLLLFSTLTSMQHQHAIFVKRYIEDDANDIVMVVKEIVHLLSYIQVLCTIHITVPLITGTGGYVMLQFRV